MRLVEVAIFAWSAVKVGAVRVSEISSLAWASSPAQRTVKMFEASSQYGSIRDFKDLESCSLPCTQAANADEADVIYAFNGDDQTPPKRANDNQVLVSTFWESPEHYPARSSDFDYSVSFRPDSTFANYSMIPALFADIFDEHLALVRKDAPFPRQKSFDEKAKSRELMSMWISNCFTDGTDRIYLAQQLVEAGLKIASYGRCPAAVLPGNPAYLQREAAQGEHAQAPASALLQTADAGSTQEASIEHNEGMHVVPAPRDRELYDTSSSHLFYFAAENSKCAYYHTEKVYNAFLSGSIPVYVGNSDTIDDYVPQGSIIKYADFRNPAELAEYLKKVAANETLYNSYFDWHHQNLQQTNPSLRAKLLTLRGQGDRCAECAYFHSHGRNTAFNAKVLGCQRSQPSALEEARERGMGARIQQSMIISLFVLFSRC